MAKATRITTPIGQAVYPHLNKPDTAFNQSKYSCKLIFTKKEAAPLFKQLDEIYDKAYKIACLQNNVEKLDSNKKPYGKDGDDYFIMAKQDTSSKDGKYQFSIALVDSKGNPTDVLVGSGSRVRLSVEPSTYLIGGNKFGLTLRLRAAQVIEVCDKANAGFDVVEGGYVSEDLSEAFEDEVTTGNASNSDF